MIQEKAQQINSEVWRERWVGVQTSKNRKALRDRAGRYALRRPLTSEERAAISRMRRYGKPGDPLSLKGGGVYSYSLSESGIESDVFITGGKGVVIVEQSREKTTAEIRYIGGNRHPSSI